MSAYHVYVCIIYIYIYIYMHIYNIPDFPLLFFFFLAFSELEILPAKHSRECMYVFMHACMCNVCVCMHVCNVCMDRQTALVKCYACIYVCI
jgi:hypothetical protein